MSTQRRFALLVTGIVPLLLGLGFTVPALAKDNPERSGPREQSVRSDDDRNDRDDDRHGDDDDDDEQVWSGQFCNGDPVSITYTVEDRAVTVVAVSGPANRVVATPRGARVVFDDDGGTISLRRQHREGGDRLRIRARLGHCPDGQPPTTTANTAIPSTTTAGPTDPSVTDPATTVPATTGPTATMPSTTAGVTTIPQTTVPQTTATTTPTSAPTTPPTPVPTTVAPTTIPATVRKYLTYTTPAGTITVELNGNTVTYWAINTPDWKWFAEKKTGTSVKVLLANRATDEQATFTVTASNGNPVASFTSASGGTITPAAPTVSTVAPATSAPSGN